MNELAFLLTPIGITLAVFLLVIAYIHTTTTMRALNDTKRVRDQLLQAAKQQARRSFTIVVTLTRRADTMWPLLDHLAGHGYKKLHVLVIVKPTAGSKALSTLRAYRRSMPSLKMTFVTYRKGMQPSDLVGRYATGDYILPLNADMRLSPDFFTQASYGLVQKPTALSVRTYHQPQATLLSGFSSIDMMWQAVIRRLDSRPTSYTSLTDGIIMAKKSVVKQEVMNAQAVMSDEFGIDTAYAPTKPYITSAMSALWTLVGLTVLLSLLAVLIATTPSSVLPFILLLMAIVYLVSSALLMTSMKGLRTASVVQMVMLTPFYPLYVVVRSLVESVSVMVSQLLSATRPRQPQTRR